MSIHMVDSRKAEPAMVRYLMFPAAAEYLGMSEKALRSRVQRRTIPFIKNGKIVRFDIKELDRFFANYRVGTSAEAKEQMESVHHEATLST